MEQAETNTTAVSHQYDERTALLTVYCGVSEGVMAGVNVVANNRAEFFLVGKPLKGKRQKLIFLVIYPLSSYPVMFSSDAATAEHLAGPGESVISPSVLRILKTNADAPIASKIVFTSVDKDGGEDSFHKVVWSCTPIVEEILSYFDEYDGPSCKRDAQSLINELVQATEVTADEVGESTQYHNKHATSSTTSGFTTATITTTGGDPSASTSSAALKLDLMRLFEHHRHEAARDVVGRFTAELRRVAVLFISIKFEPTLSDDPSEDYIVLDKFQSIYSIISDSVSSRSGQIRQFIYDDKGTVFIARYVCG